jgi:hypothetical protein
LMDSPTASPVCLLLCIQAPQVQCDARTALVLAGFIGMHLRHSHGGVYRHCVPEHKKVAYLCVENEAVLDELE